MIDLSCASKQPSSPRSLRPLFPFYYSAGHKMHKHKVHDAWLGPNFRSHPGEPYWAHGFERLSAALFGCSSLSLPEVKTSSGRMVRYCPEGAEEYRLNRTRDGWLLQTPDWHPKEEDVRDDDWRRRMLGGR